MSSYQGTKVPRYLGTYLRYCATFQIDAPGRYIVEDHCSASSHAVTPNATTGKTQSDRMQHSWIM